MLGLSLKVETVASSKQKKHPGETSEQRVRRLAVKQEKIARMCEKEAKKVSMLSVVMYVCAGLQQIRIAHPCRRGPA